MAIKKVSDCQGHVLCYKECNRLQGVCTVAIRKVTECQGPVLWL